eukprot:CAMPEP_0119549886 /NCGR_PEP_ID=MMETSP1352-20130426/3513_1 /TAXON_ID=265584 /ORGANISM="Stauroneis constricta, Strain CCMP1120" /LENGTH=55 /DNA_ID=CAMNT_0007595571 /DNA_START=55 /DNA_END=219 /DNA_ORIENTATION=-
MIGGGVGVAEEDVHAGRVVATATTTAVSSVGLIVAVRNEDMQDSTDDVLGAAVAT